MGQWRLGASTKEFGRLSAYSARFDLLEIDLETAGILGFAIDSALAQAMPFADKVYSVHLRYKRTSDADGIAASLADLAYLCRSGIAEHLGIQVFVTHTDYPQNPEELRGQLHRLAKAAEEYDVTLVVENLADRNNNTNDFMAPRNPRAIAAAIEQVGSRHLGLCLDTGHAISNAGLTDSLRWDENVLTWLRHIHYNDNTFRADDHLRVSPMTSEKLIAGFKHLLAKSTHDGAVILEHRRLTEAVDSLEFIESERYAEIAPTMFC